MLENEKKIKRIKDRIDSVKRTTRIGNWYNLTEKEKERVMNHEKQWKKQRISELTQELRRLKENEIF